MARFSPPTTTNTLLQGLCEQSDGAWARFDRFYRPYLFRLARRPARSEVAALDAVQETMSRAFEGLANYDRESGRLRAWICGILRNVIRGVHPEPHCNIDDHELVCDDVEFQRMVQEEWERHKWAWALHELRKTRLKPWKVRVFESLIRRDSPSQIAMKLDLSRADVYRAKCECTIALKRIVRELGIEYDDD